MNVLSEAAITDLGAFATWLSGSDVAGVLIRSGKETAFCAGVDLTELGVAYDMIMAPPPQARFDLAFDQFFPAQRGTAQAGNGGQTGGRGDRGAGVGRRL